MYKTTRERIVRYSGELNLNNKLGEDIKTSAADLYFLYYSNIASIKENKNDDAFLENVRTQLNNYVQTPEFSKMRSYSRLNDRISMIYSINFVKQLKEQIKKNENENENVGQNTMKDMIGKAMSESEEKTKKTNQLEKLIKTNRPGGKLASHDDIGIDKLMDLSDRIINVQNTEKIISMANKLFDIMPKFSKKMRTRSNIGELGGYYKTKNISNVLSRELALPDEIFYSKIINGFTGKERVLLSEGSYYVLLDKSGSMYEADKMVWSRSVALALFKLAMAKNRKYFFRFFDNKPYDLVKEPYDVVNNILTVEANKGTCIECALVKAIEDIQIHGMSQKTNTIIIITDGEDKVNPDIVEKLISKIDLKIITVMINGTNDGLKLLSEKYLVARLTEEGALKLLNIAKSM